MIAAFWFAYLMTVASQPHTVTYPVAVAAYLRIVLSLVSRHRT